MEFKLLGDRAEVEALNKYPTGCIKHLGLVKYVKGLCKRQQATTLSEVIGWLKRYSDAGVSDCDDLMNRLKAAVADSGVDLA